MSDPLKIAIISLYLPTGLVGGVPLQVHLLAEELCKRAHRVTVFSLFEKPLGARYEVRRITLPRWARFCVNRIMGSAIHFFPWYVAKEDFAGFDIIHAHGDSHFIPRTKPIIRTFHSSGLDQALHASSLRNCLGMLSIYPFEILSGLKANQRIFVSNGAPKYYPFDAHHVINNAVDPEVFYPGGSKTAFPSILFVAGTALGRKRGDRLVQIFNSAIKPRFPESELWMVCREQFHSPGVKSLGHLQGRLLADRYRQAWIFCLPSRHETFGVPYVEAMACGSAILATPNDGSREVLADGQYGCIVEMHSLGTGLLDLILDGSLRDRMAERGVQRAARYSVKIIADQYEKIYTEVLSQTR